MPYDINAFRNNIGKQSYVIPANKIITWIEKNFDYKTRRGGEEYIINNPFDGDTDFKFNINPENGVCHYWRGDDKWAGPINPGTGKRNCSFINFVKKYKTCSYHEAVKAVLGSSENLSDFLKPETRHDSSKSKKTIAVALPKGSIPISGSVGIEANAIKKWLNRRGYTTEDIENNDLHHFGMTVYWPYYEFESLVYYQGRSSVDKTFKFPSTEIKDESGEVIAVTEGSRNDYVYGFDDVSPASYTILVEAIFCKHTLGPQALATGGAVLAKKQVDKLNIIGPKHGVILAPDNDKAGLLSIIANSRLLSKYKIYYSIPPKIKYKDGYSKDWNDLFFKCGLTKKEIGERFENNIKRYSISESQKIRTMVNDLDNRIVYRNG